MKIVIDITDEMWQAVQDGWVGNDLWHSAIKNCTPLPKGHGRLIDADALYDQYEYADYDFDKTMEYAPTIIEAYKTESEEER